MPNHVTHRVVVSGPADNVASFVAAFILTPVLGEQQKVGLDFDMIVPSTPDNPDWYNWNVTNWGTKWNAYSYHEVSSEPERFEFLFDTAWASPVPIFEAMAVRPEVAGLTITIVGFDEGWGFAYRGTIEGGELLGETLGANDELYAEVYGEPPTRDDEEDAAEATT